MIAGIIGLAAFAVFVIALAFAIDYGRRHGLVRTRDDED